MRVVAGELKGRRLVAPKGLTVRPTSDRVKEALFSMLGSLEDRAVLDLYAGTGALGIEAISRGASSCAFVEKASDALAALRENLRALAIEDRVKVLAIGVERASKVLLPLGPFDRVLVDPPYADVGRSVEALATFAANGVLAPTAVMVVEHASRDNPTNDALELLERRGYGDTTLSFFSLKERSAS